VTPSPMNVAKGQIEQLVATATYSDGTSAQVSNSVAWRSVDTNTATVTPSGLLTGVEVGLTTVTAMKDGITSNRVSVNVSAAVITAIQVTTPSVDVAKGLEQPLAAIATYSDGTSAQVTNSVAWTSVDTNTATVTPSGLLSGVEVGTTTVTAMKDGITSNTVNVKVCRDLGGPCIDIFDTGSGKLFTSTPSYGYTSKMNFSNSGISGYHSSFDWDNSNNLCYRYNTKSIGGRSNWRLATRRELKELHDVYGNMNTARGWPIGKEYWSVTPDGSSYYYVDLRSGYTGSTNPVDLLFASCVSEP
ncbi:Ig-like domain-containing protein, partial [Vibrio cholerae]|nr:Ig-like domain-containing protein [Vibrio cholerae]